MTYSFTKKGPGRKPAWQRVAVVDLLTKVQDARLACRGMGVTVQLPVRGAFGNGIRRRKAHILVDDSVTMRNNRVTVRTSLGTPVYHFN